MVTYDHTLLQKRLKTTLLNNILLINYDKYDD